MSIAEKNLRSRAKAVFTRSSLAQSFKEVLVSVPEETKRRAVQLEHQLCHRHGLTGGEFKCWPVDPGGIIENPDRTFRNGIGQNALRLIKVSPAILSCNG